MNSELYLIISEESRYVNVGVLINDELNIVQINFINNANNWGVVVVDPDGNKTIQLARLQDNVIKVVFEIQDSDLSYQLHVERHDGRFDVNLISM